MSPIHSDNSLFPCSRCGKPTRNNDLLGGNTGRVQICAPCLHLETIQELTPTHDTITDHNHRGEEPSPYSTTMEDPDIEWKLSR